MTLGARRITLSRGPRVVLRELSLTVRPGQVLGILGRNGAGKTTLLRALAGLQGVDSGDIVLDGKSLYEMDRRARAKRIGYLEQSGTSAWPISARDLVALGRLPHRPWPSRLDQHDHAAIERALAATDAVAFADRAVDTLSSGERARVLLARVLAGEPSVLLADEPAASLDPAHQLRVMSLLRTVAAKGMLVVVVLHDLSLAARFCDRLALLAEGALLIEGAPQEVLVDRYLAQGFGIVAIDGVHENQRFVLPWREVL